MMRHKVTATVLSLLIVTAVFLVGFTTTAGAQDEESIRITVPEGNAIDVRVTNAKEENAIPIEFSEDTAAEDRFGMDLESLELYTSRDVSLFTVNLGLSQNVPSGTSRIDGVQVLSYVDIQHSIDSSDLADITFTFSVSKSNLDEIGVGAGNVVLYRHTGSEWSKIDVEQVDETPSKYTYEAELSSLSVFAIGAERPVFEVTNASVSSNAINEGGSVDVTADVSNTGNAEGTYTVNLRVDDETVDSKSVSVPAGGSTSVSFTSTFDEIGVYEVSVNDVSAGELRVESGGSGDGGTQDGNGSDGNGGSGMPGFTVIVAVVALAGAALVLRES